MILLQKYVNSRSSLVPADLQSAGLEPGDLQSPLSLLHHLVRINHPVLQCDAHRVGACGQLAHVDALEGLALGAHEAPLQVVELHMDGLHIG